MEVADNFIIKKIEEFREKYPTQQIITRFPPEPNGFLHIGHAKSICLNFGIAQRFQGKCYLRYDDTNPIKEDALYVQAIRKDIEWLGFQWDKITYASDYFESIFQLTLELIRRGDAYVCFLSPEETKHMRGTLTTPGSNSPYRHQTIEENIEYFKKMASGDFDDGECVLRAKIDMSSPNLNMRDPILYRIRKTFPHHRTGNKWCIYPTYDYAHAISDGLEEITHSLCTLEFEDHRPLYNWVIEKSFPSQETQPTQIEFSGLGLAYTLVSKRFLAKLIADQYVEGWDDPRMPTLSALRKRGVPPEVLIDFCERVGVTKQENKVEISLLNFCIRNQLENQAIRGMGILNPLKIIITNYPENNLLPIDSPWHPKQPELLSRPLQVTKVLWIEASDFSDDPPPKYKRLVLNATPVELIATPGTGKAIKILAFSIFFDYLASNFTFNADIQAKIDTTSVVTTLVHGSTSPMAADTITTLQPIGGIKLPLNKALKLHGGGTTAGGGSVQVKVRYQVLDTSLF